MSIAGTIEALRVRGAAVSDPVRFRYVDSLARRLADADASLQPLLEEKLRLAVERLAAGMDRSDATALPQAVGETAAEPQNSAAELPFTLSGLPATAPRELRSAERFRESWGRMRAAEDVEEAINRQPEGAGPLNSHALMVRTLTLMRELSPGYLNRYLGRAEALLWLELQRVRSNGAP